MNKHQITYVFLLVMMAATITPAAGPYAIRTSEDPAGVETAPPLAVVATSPFDGATGILSDGLDHYYVVTDGAGLAVDISVDKNPALDTLRISFNDDNPLSAPVHPGMSTVTVAPATIDADGVSQAIVTIIPRDAAGVALGTGLALELDTASLWPGRVTGIVSDQINGSYVVSIVSAFPGSGYVQVTVEGIALADTPTITYEEVLLPGNLLEWAIRLLQDLTVEGGEYDQLLAESEGSVAGDLDAALNHTLDALTGLLNPDAGVHDEAVDLDLKRAVGEMMHVLASVDAETTGEVISLVNSLLEAGRNVAMYYILLSGESCGTCTETGGLDICKSEATLAQGDQAWQETPPNYMLAITKYGLAISQAVTAGEVCL